MNGSRIRIFVIGLAVVLSGALMPTNANAETTYSCNGGNFSLNADGLVTGFEICTGALEFPEGAKTLSAYEGFNRSITSIKFPSTFNDFNRLSTAYTPELTSFSVAANNPNAASVDGVLYSKNLSDLLRFPPGRAGNYKVIPDATSINTYAFLYSKLSSLDLGQSVTKLDVYSLYYMTDLKKLDLSPTLQIIGEDSLLYTNALTTITVPESNPNFRVLEGNLVSKDGTTLYLYPAGKTETACRLPAGLKKLARSSMAVVPCTSIEIPDTVEEFESSVFIDSSIQTLSLPANIKKIGQDFTYGARSLRQISLTSSNPNFTVIDNVLYDKAVTRLYSFPIASPTTSYVLPSTVTNSVWYLAEVDALTEIVANSNATYKDIEGVLFNSNGSELVAYPKGRTNSFYFLPLGTRKIASDGIASGALQTIIALEDTTLIDAGYQTVYSTSVGIKRIADLDSTFRTESARNLADLRKQIDGLYEAQNKLYEEANRNSNVLNASISGGFLQQVPCKNGTISVNLANTLTSTQGCTGVLEIPNIVQEIGYYSISAPEITTIRIPASVTKISDFAFNPLSKLTAFVVDPKNENFVAIDGVLFDSSKKKLIAYPAGKSATSYEVPSSVTSIGSQAFSAAPLKTIKLSEGLESIAREAFVGSAIEKISLPSTVKTIDTGAFSMMANLSEFSVASSNNYFAAKEGVLYTKNGQTFVKYPEGKTTSSYAIAAGTKAIAREAFRTAPLKSLVIPEGVETLESYTFSASAISNISLPSTIKNVQSWSFEDMPYLDSFLLSAENRNYRVVDGFLLSFDGTELIKAPNISSKASYIVPSTVKRINSSAFQGTKIKEITIPPSVLHIDDFLLSGTEVEKLNLPSTLESFGDYAVTGAYSLKEITIPADSKSYAAVDGVLYSKDLKTLIAIPTNKAITEFTIPNTVTTIASYALSSSEMQKLTIPASVTEIGLRAFVDPYKLSEIVVDPANKNFKSVNGVLYNAEVTKLIHYPFDKKDVSFEMPDTVTTLDSDVYFYNKNLKSLYISKSLYSLNAYQFLYLENLTQVIYDGTGAQIHRGLFVSTARFIPSSVIAAEKEAAASIAGLKADLKSAQDNKSTSDTSAKNALAAQVKAEAEAKAATEAKVKAEADAKAIADAKSASDAELATAKLQLASAFSELAKWKPNTITCVKGKTTKKVTAVNAKCPAGYKKK